MKRLCFAAVAVVAVGVPCLLWMRPASSVPSVLVLSQGNGKCCIDRVGGRIVSYEVDGTELLWNDDPPQRTAPDWAHGGIPLCWPWFGDDGKGNIHGKAWRQTFDLRKEWASQVSHGMELGLIEGDLELTYDVTLRDGGGLLLETRVKNNGTTNSTFTLGFHPYFRAENRDAVTVDGLDGCPFEDDPSFPCPQKGVWKGALCVTNYIDRIFAVATNGASAVIRNVLPQHDLQLTFGNFTGVNVWNPGKEKNCPGVVPGDAWRRFVCVEPVRCAPSGTVCLGPGESAAFVFVIRLLGH